MEIDFPQIARNKSELSTITQFACFCLSANIDIFELS